MRSWLLIAVLGACGVAHAGTEASPETLPVYDVGKRLYDSKDYPGALARFDECARMEPQNARWPYNRGLALKKLGRTEEAREALLAARTLDPDYKRKEIDQKLSELGPPPSSSAGGPSSSSSNIDEHFGLIFGAAVVGILVLVGSLSTVIFLVVRRSSAKHEADVRATLAQAEANRAAAEQALRRLGPIAAKHAERLTRLEHALSLGEDADARAHVDRASNNLKLARTELKKLRDGGGNAQAAESALTRAGESIAAADARLTGLYGAAVDTAQGEKVGCFFCARPLPTPESRHAVTLKQGGQDTTVVVCATCARNAAAGQAPKTLTVNGKHWSQVPGFDPYVHSHAPFGGATEQPAWTLGPLGTLAAVAGGAAVAGLAGRALASVLDLDGLKASSRSSFASQAAAASAHQKRRSREDWRDNS